MQSKILLIGDSCKDIFYYCDAKRLCPDIPVPILTINTMKSNPGMAMNVHRNISSYIKSCDIITNDGWQNITKIRYIDEKSNHMFIRIDANDKLKGIDLKNINFEDYELIAISDYNKGFLSEKNILEISKQNIPVFMDTKKVLGKWAKYIDYIKINNYEYTHSEKSIKKYKYLQDKIIHTDGGNGCYYKNKNYPVDSVEVKDSSGAGDTFFAGLLIKYIETKDIEKSIIFANKCASKVVQEKGVTTL